MQRMMDFETALPLVKCHKYLENDAALLHKLLPEPRPLADLLDLRRERGTVSLDDRLWLAWGYLADTEIETDFRAWCKKRDAWAYARARARAARARAYASAYARAYADVHAYVDARASAYARAYADERKRQCRWLRARLLREAVDA